MMRVVWLATTCTVVAVDALALSSSPIRGNHPMMMTSFSDARRREEKTVVVVVGAGLGGLALSLGLARLGYAVELAEKRTAFTSLGATFGLRPNGVKALEEICEDVVPPLRQVGVTLDFLNGTLMLPWRVVRDSLLDQVQQRSDCISLRMGMDLQDLHDGDDCITGTFKGRDGTMVTLTGSLLVGCDGVSSKVRQLLGLTLAQSSGAKAWRSSVTVPPDSKLVPLLDKGVLPLGMPNYGPCTLAAFNFHPKLPCTIAWTLTTKEKDIAAGTHPWTALEPHVDKNDDQREQIKELFDLSLPDDLGHVLDLRTIDPRSAHTETSGWGGKGRVTLLADAAHAIRPASGLGGSLAFEDGVVLCRALAAAATTTDWWKDPVSVAALIASFENARLPRVCKIWNDEWERSESAYTDQPMGPPTEEYTEWLHAGV